jgi:hypothetical protein
MTHMEGVSAVECESKTAADCPECGGTNRVRFFAFGQEGVQNCDRCAGRNVPGCSSHWGDKEELMQVARPTNRRVSESPPVVSLCVTGGRMDGKHE